jgi:hypothetical protein
MEFADFGVEVIEGLTERARQRVGGRQESVPVWA